MFIKKPLGLAIAALVFAPVGAYAEVEVSVELKNETAVFAKSGQVTGEADSMRDNDGHDAGDLMKFENSARFFINGDLGEESSWHAELRPVLDTEGATSYYRSHQNNTQNDWFRELYADTSFGGWDLRLGKQQVVWGTADGIKLLDIINPTDFRELNQNAIEDARIPIWMVNAERYIGDRANVQLIVSQVEQNKIPGLSGRDESGQPFIAKGVDTITGQVNGFRQIAPALSRVANSFSLTAFGGGFDVDSSGAGDPLASALNGFGNLSVDGFAGNPFLLFNGDGSIQLAGGAVSGAGVLSGIAQSAGPGLPPGNANNNVTNLVDTSWNPRNPTSAFEYMPNATFATFNSFSGSFASSGIQTEYKREYPDDLSANAGFRFRSSLDNGLNYSVNYFYHYDANPTVDVGWVDAQTGQELRTQRATHVFDAGLNGGLGGLVPDQTTNLSASQVPKAFGGAGGDPTILLRNPETGSYYGILNFDPNNAAGASAAPTMSANGAALRFTESLNRIHSIGGSFDYAMQMGSIPLVLRGEFLYDKDVSTPIVDKKLLAIGDLANALTTQEADYFKYVIGADITVFTNLLVSGQFIQFRNLDFVDEGRGGCTTQTGQRFNCDRYTADQATLHLTNGLQKGYENKEFYSLFLSKPFGANQLGRVNNIIIYEEGDGYWNRLDAEYSVSDQLILTGEINTYWGDENTIFGQFKNSSNVQVGLKYIIE